MSLIQDLREAIADLHKPFAGMIQVFRVDEEAWTDDDWERDFVETEEFYKHKDDDRI